MADLQAVTITGAFLFGMVLALLGSIKLALAKRFGIGEASVGGLLSALNLALIPMMLLSGVLIDNWGSRNMIILGSLVTALAIFGLTLSRRYELALSAILLAGAGGACVSTGAVVLMPKAFWPDQAAASLNLGNVFFGLGALVTPALTDWLLRRLDFRRALELLSLLCLVPALIAAIAPAEHFAADRQQGDLAAVLGDARIWLAGFVFFLYGPLEGTLGTWATTYLTNFGHSERRAAWLLSGFWLTFLASRLLVSLLQHHRVLPSGSEAWLILILALLAAVALGNLAGASSRSNAAWGLLLLGALFGPIFPTLVAIVFKHFPGEPGTAYGAMFAVGATGSLILPPLIGLAARRTTVQQALRIPMMVALLLVLVTLVLGLYH